MTLPLVSVVVPHYESPHDLTLVLTAARVYFSYSSYSGPSGHQLDHCQCHNGTVPLRIFYQSARV